MLRLKGNTIMTKTIESVVHEMAPSTVDDAICSYMAEMLRDWPGGGDSPEDNEETEEDLVTAVAQFLDDDGCNDDQTTSHEIAQTIVKTLISMGLIPSSSLGENRDSGCSAPVVPHDRLVETKANIQEADGPRTVSSSSAPLRRLSAPTTIMGKQEQQVTENVTEPTLQTTNITEQSSTSKSSRRRKGGPHHGNRNSDDFDPPKQQQQQSTENSSNTTGPLLPSHNVSLFRGRLGAGRTKATNIHLKPVSITLPNGTELVRDAVLDILPGHCYGLIGRNGCGKSTLMQQLARHAIPGLPPDLRVLLVEQQQDIPVVEDNNNHEKTNLAIISALDLLVESDTYRTWLLREQERLETSLLTEQEEEEEPSAAAAETDVAAVVDVLEQLATELDAIQADTAEPRALAILQGLQFTTAMMHGPASHLSGGWRMRLALARALFLGAHDTDLIICLDECTNHLDLYGLDWLMQYIVDSKKTFIVVSHDRTFLDAICTDIIVLEQEQLRYHVGNYSQYQQQRQEKAAREAQILDAAERQQTKAMAFVQKQQQQAAANKKSGDPNKQRQAKMIRDKKMDRIGNYREDGKRYKLRSLKKLDEKWSRLAQKVNIEVDEPLVQMYFANPTWPPSVGPRDAIVRLENLNFGYSTNDDDPRILKNVTLSLNRGSKVALVGKNGSGKSTLVKLISGELTLTTSTAGTPGAVASSVWRHPNIRVAHLTQYAVEELEQYAHQTVVEYAEQHLMSGRATSSTIAKSAGSGNVRQYLGAFGLGGKHAHRPIGKLSGGERMRLAFAKVLSDEPHCLLLDEATNHIDIETLESMSKALADYEGTVLMVSHNQAFLSGFCQELWVLEDGRVTINKSDTDSFDEIFSQYRRGIAQQGSLSDQRQHKANLAKRAIKQRAGAQQSTALL